MLERCFIFYDFYNLYGCPLTSIPMGQAGWYLCMASDPLYAEDEMELTSSEINLPHNLDEMPSRNPKESTTNMSSP